VPVNGVQKKATVERLAVGDILELNFLDDPTLWKAVVIENCGSEVREGRLIRTPNPWQWEARAIGESATRPTSGCAALLPARYRGRNSSSEAPPGDSEKKGKSRSEAVQKRNRLHPSQRNSEVRA